MPNILHGGMYGIILLHLMSSTARSNSVRHRFIGAGCSEAMCLGVGYNKGKYIKVDYRKGWPFRNE